jgi:hypothetical protein
LLFDLASLLETYSKPRPSGFREPLQGTRGRQGAAAFEASYRTLSGVHPRRQLVLSESCFHPSAYDRMSKPKLFLQRVVFLPVFRLLHPLPMKVTNLAHRTSLARCRANANSCSGVFWVFFTKARRMITLRPVAVT